ncbi:TPA: DUF4430 domain-containing protein [Streptococcus suis]|nr:DUF4430 domain-containing protein [Streptococcus suis]HEM6137588.1 DUF4430 domain-containing protein [Streptococcus suis]
MKKISILLTLLSFLFLTACGTGQDQEASESIQITLTITNDEGTDSQELTVESDETVMEILKENHTVVEENGLITEIDQVSQNPSTNTYWMYKINGTLAEKGANDQTVTEGDEIEFYLESFE